jgi:serine/threonine protein phosphatase PrpC
MHIHTISLIGPRPKNEDDLFYNLNLNSVSTSSDKKRNANIIGIFDGHGGPLVSKYLKEHLPKYFYADTNTLFSSKRHDYIKKVFDRMQEKLIKDVPQCKQMGSTALILNLEKGKSDSYYLQVVNIGDCRAVLCNEYNIAMSLTKDHKPMQWEEKIRIEALGGKIVKDVGDDPRINGLAVSRAFGDLDVLPYVSHVPEIFDYRINATSKFVILGCDGVWDVLSSQDAVDFVIKEMMLNPTHLENYHTHTQKNIAKKLGEYALKKGSGDNISIIILFFS